MKRVGIIGSTGSIGKQTLEVIEELNNLEENSFKVVLLTCGNNIELIAEQAIKFDVHTLCVETASGREKLISLLGNFKADIYTGAEGLELCAKLDMEYLVTAIVGMRGIMPTIAAIKNGTNIALANKETLVAAGEIVMSEARKNNVGILPVDSEHSAIFQCLTGINRDELESIILTCSGGPFRNYTKEQLSSVTLSNALNHPTWKMGGKITIDCASLMNKGLEVIEAHWLYDMPYDKIEVVVHPESIVHSMIRTIDGAVLAQLGVPSMKLPIQHALTYPKRVKGLVARPDFAKIGELHFEYPNTDKFPSLKLAYECGKIGGTMPACMNAANEKAVDMFFKNEIAFDQIPTVVERVLEKHNAVMKPTIEDILATNDWAYEQAGRIIK